MPPINWLESNDYPKKQLGPSQKLDSAGTPVGFVWNFKATRINVTVNAGWTKNNMNHTHMLHGTGIFAYICLRFLVNVAK